MSYHIFNDLAELINGDLATKIGRETFSKDLMDRECSFSLPSKVNSKSVYENKFCSKCIIYEVEFSLYDAIYIGNTQQTLKKIMNGHFSTSYVYSGTDRNQIHLLPTSNSTLKLLRNVQTYVST